VVISNNISLPGTMTFGGEGSGTLGGILSGTGGLTMNGPGQLTLGASNTFTGTTQINSGQLVMGAADGLAKSTVVINTTNGLKLDQHEFPVIGGLAGSGNLYLGSQPTNEYGIADLTVGDNNASTTYSGTLTATGIRWLQKQGTGTLTLSGSNSTCYMINLSEGSVVLSGGGFNGFLHMGATGNNTSMTIQNGAIVDSRGGDENYVVGNSTLRISGPGTIWHAGDARLAFFQGTSGNAIIENGATVTDSTKFIVGQGGPATLLLQTGATITTAVGVIGQNLITQNNPAIGTATVIGSGSLWTNTTSLSLGGLQTGITGGIGTLNINNGGAVVSAGPTTIWTAGCKINVNGGTFTTGTLVSDAGIGAIDLTDPAGGGAALTINGASGTATYNGTISGTGSLVKNGGGTQILAGALSYTGPTIVNGGLLRITNSPSQSFVVNGGMLEFPNFNLGQSSLKANIGGTIRYLAPTLKGGFLRGLGTHDLSNVTRLDGTTIGIDVSINQTAPLTLLNVTHAGSLTSNAALAIDGLFITSGGRMTLNAAATSQAFENDGVLTIVGKGALTNTGPLVLGGGSRTFIGDEKGSGQLTVTGGNLEVNGALLVNNGEIAGTTNVNFGSLAKGAGKYGPINVTDGGKFSPGNSPGSVTTGSTTWNSGGSYIVEIADALAGSGIGWDRWNINGLLDVSATNTANGRFTISLSTIDSLAANFDPRLDYTWSVLHAIDGIINFDPSAISLDTSAFKNDLSGGHFSIISSQNDLSVHFTSVPEPLSAVGLLASTCLLCARRPRGRLGRSMQ
jgi:autotransporter-associated beta strand protein/T5SS/PEP-CTERM-associated repeat protein